MYILNLFTTLCVRRITNRTRDCDLEVWISCTFFNIHVLVDSGKKKNYQPPVNGPHHRLNLPRECPCLLLCRRLNFAVYDKIVPVVLSLNMRFKRVEFLNWLATIATCYREVWLVTVNKLYMTNKELLKSTTSEATSTVTTSEGHCGMFIFRAVAGEWWRQCFCLPTRWTFEPRLVLRYADSWEDTVLSRCRCDNFIKCVTDKFSTLL